MSLLDVLSSTVNQDELEVKVKETVEQVDRAAYGALSLPPPRLKQRHMAGQHFQPKTVPDTGAQVVIAPLQLLHHLGIEEASTFPISTAINAVNAAPVDIIGGEESCSYFQQPTQEQVKREKLDN